MAKMRFFSVLIGLIPQNLCICFGCCQVRGTFYGVQKVRFGLKIIKLGIAPDFVNASPNQMMQLIVLQYALFHGTKKGTTLYTNVCPPPRQPTYKRMRMLSLLSYTFYA